MNQAISNIYFSVILNICKHHPRHLTASHIHPCTRFLTDALRLGGRERHRSLASDSRPAEVLCSAVAQSEALHRDGSLASALRPPQLLTREGRKDRRGSLPRGHSDAEKRVCLSAEARSSLDNSHILLKVWKLTGTQGCRETRQIAEHALMKHLKTKRSS